MTITKICIRCGDRYAKRERTAADAGKAFPLLYCVSCAEKLPILPVVVAQEANSNV